MDKMQDNSASKQVKRIFMRPTDLLIVGLLLLVALALYWWGRQQDDTAVKKAEIYCDNKLIAVIVLTEGEERTFNFPECPEVFFHLSERGTIAFRESSCPDKVCIKSGELSRVNDWAACLPNRVLLKIVGSADDADPDQLDLIG
jgi:hypothetical protein